MKDLKFPIIILILLPFKSKYISVGKRYPISIF
jgi:hypothetical protein